MYFAWASSNAIMAIITIWAIRTITSKYQPHQKLHHVVQKLRRHDCLYLPAAGPPILALALNIWTLWLSTCAYNNLTSWQHLQCMQSWQPLRSSHLRCWSQEVYMSKNQLEMQCSIHDIWQDTYVVTIPSAKAICSNMLATNMEALGCHLQLPLSKFGVMLRV